MQLRTGEALPYDSALPLLLWHLCLSVLRPALQAAARNMRSRKEPRQRSSSSAFKALIELGGASAQVTFMPDQQWHGGSGSGSKGQESLRLPLPGALQQL